MARGRRVAGAVRQVKESRPLCQQMALNVSAWHGALTAAIRGIAENICSWRAFRRLTKADHPGSKADGQRAAQTVVLARSRAGRAGARPNHSITGHWGLIAPDRSNLIKALNVPSYAHCERGLGDAA
jgi:hypothetical protein